MAASATTVSKDEATLVDDEESIKNRLFSYTMRSIYLSPLRVMLRLAEHIAKKTLYDFSRVASAVNAKNYVDRLAIETLEGIDIGAVTFAAQTPIHGNSTYLREWARFSNLAIATDFEVTQSFEFIQRNGGVTFNAAMTFPVDEYGTIYENAYYLIANSARSWAVQQFVDNPILAPGFNNCCPAIHGLQGRTPFLYSVIRGQPATTLLLLSVTDDQTLNRVDDTGQSVLWYAVDREKYYVDPQRLNVLYKLLCRPALEMNKSFLSISSTIDHMIPSIRQQILHVFDQAAALFAGVPHLIHQTVYHESGTTLPLPICDIIFNYYRMPYPIRNAAVATAATAQTLVTTTAATATK